MKYMLMLFLFVPDFCNADGFFKHDPWTREDSIRESVYLILHVVDWGQTRNIVYMDQREAALPAAPIEDWDRARNTPHKNYEELLERNPFLGKQPSIKRVDSYFVFTAVAHIAASYVLPRGWRESFQYTTSVVQAGFVIHNKSLGLRVDF